MVAILVSIVITVLDLYTKHLAVKTLKGGAVHTYLDDIVRFRYVENRGAAFGILQNSRIFFLIVTVFVVIGLWIYLFRFSRRTLTEQIAFGLLIGGAVGNFIDRLRLDMLWISLK